VCRVVLQLPRARHARLVADTLARILVACYEKTVSVEFKLKVQRNHRIKTGDRRYTVHWQEAPLWQRD